MNILENHHLQRIVKASQGREPWQLITDGDGYALTVGGTTYRIHADNPVLHPVLIGLMLTDLPPPVTVNSLSDVAEDWLTFMAERADS